MSDAMDDSFQCCNTCRHGGTMVMPDNACHKCINGEMWEEVVDVVNRPPHYTDHPSGIECIHVTEHMNFCLGNAIKYLWRAGLKGDAVEDMEKAIWYINREIERRKAYGDDDTTT